MRKFLNGLYALATGLSALCFVLIALMVLAQIAGRLTDRALLAMGAEPLGLQIPSLAEIGAFLFAASAALALAGTLKAGAHVRVTMLAKALPESGQRALTIIVLAGALGLAAFAAWYFALQAWDSYAYSSVSYGTIRVPLALPQGAMAFGFILFLLALLDELILEISGQKAAFRRGEEAQSEPAAGEAAQ